MDRCASRALLAWEGKPLKFIGLTTFASRRFLNMYILYAGRRSRSLGHFPGAEHATYTTTPTMYSVQDKQFGRQSFLIFYVFVEPGVLSVTTLILRHANIGNFSVFCLDCPALLENEAPGHVARACVSSTTLHAPQQAACLPRLPWSSDHLDLGQSLRDAGVCSAVGANRRRAVEDFQKP
jgi:hypothetical protein